MSRIQLLEFPSTFKTIYALSCLQFPERDTYDMSLSLIHSVRCVKRWFG